MKKGSFDPNQTEFDFNKVRMEPELQMEAATFTPAQRRRLASLYERWAHQLRVTAKVLECHQGPLPKRHPLAALPRRIVRRN